jgi:hypothetical protein
MTMMIINTRTRSSSTILFIMLVVALFSATNISSSERVSLFASAETCIETSTETFTNRKNKVKIMCQWAAQGNNKRRTRKRCKTKKKGNCGGLVINVMDECPCACSEVIDDTEVTDTSEPTDRCPVIYTEATMSNSVCSPTYQDQLTCKYDYTWIGCAPDVVQCKPLVTCVCNGEGNDAWSCFSYAVLPCPTEKRAPLGRSLLRTNLRDTGEEEEHQRRNLFQEQGTSCVLEI